MSGLTTDRNTDYSATNIFSFQPAPGVTIYRGALVAIDANGLLHPASATPGLVVVGRADTGTADIGVQAVLTAGQLPQGNVTTGLENLIRVHRGACFAYDNSPAGADQLTAANWGQSCYAADDHTLALTNGGGTRPLAGIFRGLTASGQAWVQIS